MHVSRRYLAGVLAALILCPGFLGQAWAAALGRISVTSHLGEPFFAEVTLTLAGGEKLAKLSVGLASPADYRVLELYRDPAVQKLRVDIVHDSRGDRISIRSDQPVEAPFFNLVLKVRRGHATQFKRYPVFLELPGIEVRAPVKPITPASPPVPATPKPAPAPAPSPATQPVAPQAPVSQPAATPEFRPFDGWARIARYGPMVFGDTLSTVARRLRLDDRYTEQQVMAALYVKNSDKFIEHNMNMIEAGTYLDVPTAAEVEAISPGQAKAMLAEHARRWRKLKQLPRYAVVDEAQKHRYSKRVRIGRRAIGEAGSPAHSPAGKGTDMGAAGRAGAGAASTPADSALAALRQKNERLKKQLRASERTVSRLKSGLPPDAEVLAASERIKKLELRLARLQAELEKAREDASRDNNRQMDWLNNVLAGSVVLLLIALAYLIRRDRQRAAVTPASEPAPAPVAPPPPAEAAPAEPFPDEPEEPLVEEPTDEPAPTDSEAPPPVEAAEEAVGGTPEDERPDPNIDYVAEADVYLRYGMDEEAIQQLRMAIRQNEANADAHSKLVQVLYAQGDRAALEAAIAHGAKALSGEDLALFEAAVASLDLEDAEAAEIKMLPTKEYVAGEEREVSPAAEDAPAATPSAGVADSLKLEGDENLELGSLDWTPETAGEEPELGEAGRDMAAEPVIDAGEKAVAGDGAKQDMPAADLRLEDDENLEIGGLDWSPEATPDARETVTPPAEAAGGEEEPLVSEDELPPMPAEEPKAAADTPQETADLQLEHDENLELGDLNWSTGDEAAPPEAAAPGHEGTPATEGADAEEEEIAWDDDTEPAADQLETVTATDDAGAVAGEAEAPADTEALHAEPAMKVDHLAEAEAHLRYGMDDEAVRQLRLAIGENEQNAEAHCKLVQVLYSQGRQQELEQAIVRGAEALDGDALEQFMEAVSALDMEEAEAEEVRAMLKEKQVDTEAAAELGKMTDTSDEQEEEGVDTGEVEAEEPLLDADVAEQQTFDVSQELDGLLAELEQETGKQETSKDDEDISVSPESLHVDMGRSQLAEGDLDAAEQSFTTTLDGPHACEARLGLAEVAQQRGDTAKAAELLAEAEPMLSDEARAWYDRLVSAQPKE